MENLVKPVPAKEYSPLTLAFMGDSVYELLVRNYLVSEGNCPVRSLNKRKVELVRCQSQAKALTFMWPALSEEEKEIFRSTAAEVTAEFQKTIREKEAVQIEELKAAGVEMIELKDYDTWVEAAKPLEEKYGAGFEDIIKKIRDTE